VFSTSRAVAVIARGQRKAALAGLRGQVLVLFWSLLVAVAAWAGGMAALAERQAHAATLVEGQAAYTRWLKAIEPQGWRPVLLASTHPLVLAKPPAPARALATGVAEAGGAWVAPTGYAVRELEGRHADLSPLGSALGGLDLAALVALAGALAAIALAHDAVAGERARGTLALHFTTPLPRWAFLLGKAWGTLQALLLALALPLALALLGLWLSGALPGAAWGRAVAFWGASVLYLAVWAMVGVAASAMVARPATAFMGLVGLWLLLVVAWPKASLAAATAWIPAPSAAVLEQALAAELEKSKAFYAERLGDFRRSHGGERPRGADQSRLKLAYFERHQAAILPLLESRTASLALRQRTLEALAFPSPAHQFLLLGAELAGTGPGRHEAFVQAADRYTRALKMEAERRILRGQLGPPSWGELPPLGFQEAPLRAAMSPLLARLGLLLAMALLALGLGWWAFRRADLRPAAAA
jgi:ABC-type transport system involved in multi-copper enzyme maturation permease subunit